MANKLYEEASVSDIADAIREKNGSQTQYKVFDMGDAVRAIPIGSLNSKKFTFTLTENATNGQIIVANDADVAEHYADPSFMIAASNLTGGDAFNRILNSVVCNTPNNGYYGANIYMASSAYSAAAITGDAKTAVGQKVYADSDGNLRLRSENTGSTGRPWAAGTYVCTISW